MPRLPFLPIADDARFLMPMIIAARYAAYDYAYAAAMTLLPD